MSSELTSPSAALPVDLSTMEGLAGTGFENMSSNDMAIPFLALLQSGSPAVKRGSPTKVDGAEEGDIINTVTLEIIKGEKGLRVIPCAYQKRFVEWVPREEGGGIIASHLEMPATASKNEKGRWVLPNGNDIVETAYYYVIVLGNDGSHTKAIISMTSSQLKKSRRWNSVMSSIQIDGSKGKFNPPMFSHSYHLSSIVEHKDEYTWSGWRIEAPMLVSDGSLFQEALAFHKSVTAGEVKVSEQPAPETAATPEHF